MWIKKVVVIFRFLRKARKQILPNFEELNHKISLLNKDMIEIRDKTEKLLQDKEDMYEEVSKIRLRIGKLEEQIEFIKDKQKGITANITSLQNEIKELNKIIYELKGRYENIEDTVITKIKNEFLISKFKGLLEKK